VLFTRRDHELCKLQVVTSKFFQTIEIDSRFLKDIYRIRVVFFLASLANLLQVKLEIELPDKSFIRHLTLVIRKAETDLYKLQLVHVISYEPIIILCLRYYKVIGVFGLNCNARKFSVKCDNVVLLCQIHHMG